VLVGCELVCGLRPCRALLTLGTGGWHDLCGCNRAKDCLIAGLVAMTLVAEVAPWAVTPRCVICDVITNCDFVEFYPVTGILLTPSQPCSAAGNDLSRSFGWGGEFEPSRVANHDRVFRTLLHVGAACCVCYNKAAACSCARVHARVHKLWVPVFSARACCVCVCAMTFYLGLLLHSWVMLLCARVGVE